MYAADPLVQAALDAIRLLSDPSEKQSAHVTVRGPYRPDSSYSRPSVLESYSERVRGQQLAVTGVASFFGRRQHTVFFKCESEALRTVWWKPDYPDFTPHLTLYDGPSRDFAERLLETVQDVDPRFSFAMTGIEMLVTVPGQQGGLSFLGLENVSALRDLTDISLDPLRVDELSAGIRLRGIRDLCKYLAPAD